MRINKELQQNRLRDVWPRFLKEFVRRVQLILAGQYVIVHDASSGSVMYIAFEFENLNSSVVYRILARTCDVVSTRGVLKEITERLAEISNLAFNQELLSDNRTRGESIYRSIHRYKCVASAKCADNMYVTNQQTLQTDNIYDTKT